MVQVDKVRERIDASGGSLVGSYNKNIDVTTTNAFTTILDIDSRGIRESVIIIFNTHCSNNIDYDIWGNLDMLQNITEINPLCDTNYDNGWVQLTSTTTLTASMVPMVETLSNPYSRIVIRAKATVNDNQGTVRIWHRGEN